MTESILKAMYELTEIDIKSKFVEGVVNFLKLQPEEERVQVVLDIHLLELHSLILECYKEKLDVCQGACIRTGEDTYERFDTKKPSEYKKALECYELILMGALKEMQRVKDDLFNKGMGFEELLKYCEECAEEMRIKLEEKMDEVDKRRSKVVKALQTNPMTPDEQRGSYSNENQKFSLFAESRGITHAANVDDNSNNDEREVSSPRISK